MRSCHAAAMRRSFAGFSRTRFPSSATSPRTAWTIGARASAGVDAVINATGIFEPTRGNDFQHVHIEGPKALFQACAAENIRKLIHISALGADAAAETAFHLSKRDADEYCASLADEHGFESWVVVRPSLVIGRGGYSTTLFSALAALPWSPRLGPGNWQVQPIHIADLCEAIRLMLAHDGPLPRQLDLAGPSPMTTDDLTRALRRWLCLPPAKLDILA